MTHLLLSVASQSLSVSMICSGLLGSVSPGKTTCVPAPAPLSNIKQFPCHSWPLPALAMSWWVLSGTGNLVGGWTGNSGRWPCARWRRILVCGQRWRHPPGRRCHR